MRLERFSFGSIRIDGVTYRQAVVIDRGKIRTRRKKPSRPFRDTFGHTPLSVEEMIPWKCRRLVVGTGAHGALPVLDEVRQQAAHRNVELLILPTGTKLAGRGLGVKGLGLIHPRSSRRRDDTRPRP